VKSNRLLSQSLKICGLQDTASNAYNVFHELQKGFKMSVAISIRIPEDLAKRLDSVAEETERPRSFVLQKALEAYLDDYADLQVAIDRLRDKADTLITGAEMRKSLGL
jgi:RHH-type transcriptional regulator, rel operon repressor / antitoxin RelB